MFAIITTLASVNMETPVKENIMKNCAKVSTVKKEIVRRDTQEIASSTKSMGDASLANFVGLGMLFQITLKK